MCDMRDNSDASGVLPQIAPTNCPIASRPIRSYAGRMQPGSPAWHARIAAIKEAESKQPLAWWYLSFADHKWKGAVVVQAHGIMGAVEEANRLGINPGGEVRGMRLDSSVPLPEGMEEMTNRLLSKADLAKLGGAQKW